MRKRSVLIPLIIIVALFGLGWYFYGAKPGEYAQATVTVRGAEFRVDLADTALKQVQGLSGRPALGEREGMLFLFGSYMERTFWMKDMNFAIDIIWLRDDTVVGFAENAQPEPEKTMFTLTKYTSPSDVNRVLEVPAGTVSALGITVGDQVVFRGV